MTIFNLYIFDEKGSIIYYKEWLRKKHTSMEKDEVRCAGIGKWVFILMFLQGRKLGMGRMGNCPPMFWQKNILS